MAIRIVSGFNERTEQVASALRQVSTASRSPAEGASGKDGFPALAGHPG